MSIKPFIRWAGGKQKLVNELKLNIPNIENINSYYEPFLGAGSLFFANEFPNSKISDINPQLINCYNQIKANYSKIYSLLNNHEVEFISNNQYYYRLRSLYNLSINDFSLEQAARFIFLIHTNYNGMYRINKKGFYNVPLGKLTPSLPKLNHLKLISEKLQHVTISSLNYNHVLNNVEQNDFVYLDPPYPPYNWSKHQRQYTVDHFSLENHIELSELANELRRLNCFVLISYPDIEFVREVYSDWDIKKLDTFRSISCKKERKRISELIIKNY